MYLTLIKPARSIDKKGPDGQIFCSVTHPLCIQGLDDRRFSAVNPPTLSNLWLELTASRLVLILRNGYKRVYEGTFSFIRRRLSLVR